jgi:hypothetical protein
MEDVREKEGSVMAWTYKTNWVYKKVFSGLDPFQHKDIPDCYLMSALSALAWVCRVNIKTPNAQGDVPLTISGKDFTAKKTEELPVDAAGNLNCARSSGSNETWPAIYEKMYAKFLNIGSDPDSPNNPDICNKMPKDGNALTTMVDLTSWTPNSEPAANYQKIFTDLTTETKVKYPVVASTYTTLEGIQSGYAVMPKHDYSVLGTYSEAGKDYIILRNPLGSVLANTGITMKTTGSWTYKDRCYRQSAVEYTAIYPGGVPPTKTLSFGLSQGLFALEVGEFAKYFARFGWLT